jgi:hypothetical protein
VRPVAAALFDPGKKAKQREGEISPGKRKHHVSEVCDAALESGVTDQISSSEKIVDMVA